MMLGLAHTLVVEKLHDTKFLATYTSGFDKFLPYLMGEKDKTPKTAEWASAICGIPAATLKELARRFAKSRTMLASGWSMQRQHHGEQRADGNGRSPWSWVRRCLLQAQCRG